MIDQKHPRLSIARQCKLVEIARSSYYYTAKGECRPNLELMRVTDSSSWRHRGTDRVRWPGICDGKATGWAGSESGG
jgi:hypothetical protein